MREVRVFHMISGWSVFRWAHGFYRFLGEFPLHLQRLCVFDENFLAEGLGFCIFLRGLISKQIIVLFFFVVFKLLSARFFLVYVCTGFDTGCLQHRYTDFGNTNLSVKLKLPLNAI